MSVEDLEKHLLSGLDDQQRGFSRQIDIAAGTAGYCASLHYEKLFLETEPQEAKETALLELVQSLQAHGYRQLRTRLSFSGNRYLGSVEPWIEYPDAPEPERARQGLRGMLRQFWKKLFRR